MAKIKIRVEDMHCAACSSRVEKVLSETAGVKQANVNLATLTASIDYDETVLGIDDLEQVIKDAGYTPEVDDEINKVSFNVTGMT
jgi:Cu+-exporting ATPase